MGNMYLARPDPKLSGLPDMSWVIKENWAGPVLDKDPKILGWVQILPESDLYVKKKKKLRLAVGTLATLLYPPHCLFF